MFDGLTPGCQFSPAAWKTLPPPPRPKKSADGNLFFKTEPRRFPGMGKSLKKKAESVFFKLRQIFWATASEEKKRILLEKRDKDKKKFWRISRQIFEIFCVLDLEIKLTGYNID